MPLKTHTAENELRKITRDLQHEFPDIKIIWLPYKNNDKKKALATAGYQVTGHVAWNILEPYIKDIIDPEKDSNDFTGITINADKKLFGREEKPQALACVFLDITEFEDSFALKHRAYCDLYHILGILEQPHTKLKTIKKTVGNYIPPQTEINDIAVRNLAADTFGAMFAALKGEKNAIRKIARMRAEQALIPRAGHTPEYFAFPIITDMVRLIFRERKAELQSTKRKKNTLLHETLNITQEITKTLDERTSKSWISFAEAAQIMAWSGIEPNKILGTAVYTCEDPYIRSDAYLTSEILNIEPAFLTNFEFYSPFADDELNERRHKKLCMEYLEALIIRAEIQDNKTLFTHKAKEHNEAFLKGTLCGYCAPALQETKELFRLGDLQDVLPGVEKKFKESINTISWETLKTATHLLIEYRREGTIMTPEKAIELLKNEKGLEPIAQSLSQSFLK